jgi:mRNA interferase MazF
MVIKQFEIWVADLNPRVGTEAGKKRPVVIVQTDLLNRAGHPSTIICPLTTNVQRESNVLRIHLEKGNTELIKESDILVDQIRAIDNKRLVEKLGSIPQNAKAQLKENLALILDL